MAEVETSVMNILLKSLMDQGLITADIYNGAAERVHRTADFPEFFEYHRRC